ncbi:MAG: hypothetical protein JW818_15430 [Pirellulales bacterium]|nr:hypothetical protein [Pirellulales bacterium]
MAARDNSGRGRRIPRTRSVVGRMMAVGLIAVAAGCGPGRPGIDSPVSVGGAKLTFKAVKTGQPGQTFGWPKEIQSDKKVVQVEADTEGIPKIDQAIIILVDGAGKEHKVWGQAGKMSDNRSRQFYPFVVPTDTAGPYTIRFGDTEVDLSPLDKK